LEDMPVTSKKTLANCASRASTSLGSSNNLWPTDTFDGLVDPDQYYNPLFYNYNQVYLPYCDGTSFSSSLADPVTVGSTEIYFRGYDILMGVLDALVEKHGLGEATELVITGGSAGASAVYYHTAKIASRAPNAKVYSIPDAGFFLNLPNENGQNLWPEQMKSVFALSGAYANLDENCLAKYPGAEDQWKCMFPQFYAELITIPTFNVMSLYDSSELAATLNLGCEPEDLTSKCSEGQLEDFQDLRIEHINAYQALWKHTQHGGWMPSCVSHTLTYWALWDNDWQIGGQTLQAALTSWMQGEAVTLVDPVAWPNNAPCAYNHEKKSKVRKGRRHADLRASSGLADLRASS